MLLDSSENKEKILQHFLEIAAFEGWNKESLLKALEASNINAQHCNLIFENGLLDLNDFYMDLYNQKAVAIIENLDEKKIRDKIRALLYARFEVEEKNKIALQRLRNFYLNPKNLLNVEIGPRSLLYALKDCYKIADFMWSAIGDNSTDFNYYTKRATLAKIILRSFFVFLKDDSQNLQKTKNFIDAEIEKVMRFEKIKNKVKQFSNKGKETICQFIFDEKGSVKSAKDLIGNLPFIRLIKK